MSKLYIFDFSEPEAKFLKQASDDKKIKLAKFVGFSFSSFATS